MQKVFGILLIVVMIWVGLEIFTKGTDAAFGGIFSRHAPPSAGASASGPVTDRMKDKVRSAYLLQEARTERQTDAESGGAGQ